MRNKTYTAAEALDKMRALCSKSEFCESEILERLYKMQIDKVAAERIVRLLQKDRFIDQRRFARAFVRDKYRFQQWGRLKIKAALTLKKIDKTIIAESLSQDIDQEEYINYLTAFIKSNIQRANFDNSKTSREKIIRRVASHGYEPTLIFNVINNPQSWDQD